MFKLMNIFKNIFRPANNKNDDPGFHQWEDKELKQPVSKKALKEQKKPLK